MSDISELEGKSILVGITVLDADGELIEQFQVHGEAVEASEEVVVIVLSDSGRRFSLPPARENFSAAKRGEYRVYSTGELVVDPDFISTWTVRNGSESELDRYKREGFLGYERCDDT
ncbi:MAG: hypothetical protein AAF497_28285 [Planctomycetota bacterium]